MREAFQWLPFPLSLPLLAYFMRVYGNNHSKRGPYVQTLEGVFSVIPSDVRHMFIIQIYILSDVLYVHVPVCFKCYLAELQL